MTAIVSSDLGHLGFEVPRTVDEGLSIFTSTSMDQKGGGGRLSGFERCPHSVT